ncbi:MAG TPA: phosphoribosylformylglycinamidine cyclo-ligase [Spirochaetia bacterium]|nr:phosphoribosylformylglycinamidine cyclo-ligase [Spirochaetales bacterium]HRS64481.1 phosphoribosylformylglycinamidine cyclo-ligase [Spirochaetia bacterium]HOT59464.1 phosphoribosylformylglycinamidine cyclo-ligase [Spirochaetales bacterium]HPD80765.1 phosphoribosylformylglycinamidine cyclo-ligase [Spirochaetales bacterium]HQK34025.1 phosphoribosylformylglycinamidine cyclo-ligase [Spirochaetales bacterium]
MAKTYRDSGVDIEKGDAFADFIKNFKSPAVGGGIGGFAGGIPLQNLAQYKDPLLLSTTDGVGTKLLVAKKLNKWDTIGIDLVAMNVNDLIVCGCKPLTFLDYIATGSVAANEKKLQTIISGIIRGCEIADCLLTGGETAEMPDIYASDEVDLAGFCVGIVDRSHLLPHLDTMQAGDVILGIPSSGVHSNGYSLARKCIPETDTAGWEELLIPTRIYVKELLTLFETNAVLAAAHITGSGLEANFERVIPKQLKGNFTWDWPRPSIFEKIQTYGEVPEAEMRRVFNLGIGIAFVVHADQADDVIAYAANHNIEVLKIGTLVHG